MSYSEVSSLDSKTSSTATKSTVFSRINPIPLVLKKVKSRQDLNKGLPSPPLPVFSYQDLNNASTISIPLVSSSSSSLVAIATKENVKEKNFFSNFGGASKLSKRLNQLPSPIFPPPSNSSTSSSSNSSISPESFSRPSLSSSEYSSLYPNSSAPTSPNTPGTANSYTSGGDIYSPLLRPSVQPISLNPNSSYSKGSSNYHQPSFAPSRITVPTSNNKSFSSSLSGSGRREMDLADMRFDFFENEVEERNEEEEQKAIEWKRMQEFEDRLMREDNNFDISMKKLYLL